MPEPVQESADSKSFFGIIIHSFFVIPFFIALAAVLLFGTMHWLTREQLTAYDYLEQVRVGGMTKRWQAAFELSKILANPKLIPAQEQFITELKSAFTGAAQDDPRVRQYLALAMGRTGKTEFVEVLVASLADPNTENLFASIYALGMLKDPRSIGPLTKVLDHPNARTRSMTVAALGAIGRDEARPALRRMLTDPEPNVQWGAAISLAKLKDPSGTMIVRNLLSREYLSQFPAVDANEQTQLILQAVQASQFLNDPDLWVRIRDLSKNDNSMHVRATALAALEDKQ